MRIIVNKKPIFIGDVKNSQCVYGMLNGRIIGMVIYVPDKGYIHKTSVTSSSLSGFHKTFSECINAGEKMGYRFVVELYERDLSND